LKIKFKIFFLYIFFLVSPYIVHAIDKGITEYDYLKFLGESIEKIKTDYVESIENKEIVESAINGILSSLDRY